MAKVTFFPVGNGDMTLIELDSGRTILVDVNIRCAADDPDDDTPDVAKMLRERLKKDDDDRYYVDAFLLSHPDQDHCRGLKKHFHLGKPDKHDGSDKILIREMWSSPVVFRRASRKDGFVFCDDADAWRKEAKRRANLVKDGEATEDGDRIQILGEDEDGKTDDLTSVLVKVDENITKINGLADGTFTGQLLAPLPLSEDEEEEASLTKNDSSVIVRFDIKAGGTADACCYLTGGDAEVGIWKRLWKRHENTPKALQYDLLQAPHHCSWHSLSYDSWSEKGDDAEVCDEARSALAQARDGAFIVASSNEIKDDKNDPPCIRAKREYEDIAGEAKGRFKWVGEKSPDCLIFEITADGPRPKTKLTKPAAIIGAGSVGATPLSHG